MWVIANLLYSEIVVPFSPTSPISFSFVFIKPVTVAIEIFKRLYTRWPGCHLSPLFSLGFSITLHSISPSMCTFFSLCPAPFLSLSTFLESEDCLFQLRGGLGTVFWAGTGWTFWCVSLSQKNLLIPPRSQWTKPAGLHIHHAAPIMNSSCCFYF